VGSRRYGEYHHGNTCDGHYSALRNAFLIEQIDEDVRIAAKDILGGSNKKPEDKPQKSAPSDV